MAITGGLAAQISPLRSLSAGLSPLRIGGRGAARRRLACRSHPTEGEKTSRFHARFPTAEARFGPFRGFRWGVFALAGPKSVSANNGAGLRLSESLHNGGL